MPVLGPHPSFPVAVASLLSAAPARHSTGRSHSLESSPEKSSVPDTLPEIRPLTTQGRGRRWNHHFAEETPHCVLSWPDSLPVWCLSGRGQNSQPSISSMPGPGETDPEVPDSCVVGAGRSGWVSGKEGFLEKWWC